MADRFTATGTPAMPFTVKSHLGRAMGKIGARDRVQTVVWAYRSGIAAVP